MSEVHLYLRGSASCSADCNMATCNAVLGYRAHKKLHHLL